jgi:hypothetical protein
MRALLPDPYSLLCSLPTRRGVTRFLPPFHGGKVCSAHDTRLAPQHLTPGSHPALAGWALSPQPYASVAPLVAAWRAFSM